MSVYNARDERELDAAVASILNQKDTDLEFIICDDGSDEDGRRLLREVLKWDERTGVSDRDHRIKLITSLQHRGIAHGLNLCIDQARGKYIARMDADDVSMKDRLETEVGWLEKNPDFAFVGSAAYLSDGREIWGTRRYVSQPAQREYMRFSPFIHPTVMFRRDVLTAQRYEESDVTYECEDYELFLRLRRQGYCGANIEEPLYVYKEDRASYRRRTVKRRIREMQIRYRYFIHEDAPFLQRMISITRPVAGIVMPYSLIVWLKRKENGYVDKHKAI